MSKSVNTMLHFGVNVALMFTYAGEDHGLVVQRFAVSYFV